MPPGKVGNGRNKPTLAAERKVVFRAPPTPGSEGEISRGQIAYRFSGARRVPCRRHAEGGEDAPIEKILKGRAPRSFSYLTEQHEPGIGIEISGTRWEIETTLAADSRHQILACA